MNIWGHKFLQHFLSEREICSNPIYKPVEEKMCRAYIQNLFLFSLFKLCDMHGLVVAQGVFMYVGECNLKSKVWKTI